ncbi:hypothetical protein A7975_20635 [Bacillus sp. FJAT-26390]|nr:hypothetical protein A7975_20635 [Bacillus sp. FJAT-26390]
MTTIGILAISILASLLFVVLDMGVYRESLGPAFYKQTLAYNSWQTYLMVIAAFIIALFRDWRSLKQSQGRKRLQRLRGERQSDRNNG